MNKVSVIICAAGKGERAGLGKNKLLAPLYGEPVLFHTLKKFDTAEIGEIIVTSSPHDYDEISAISSPFGAKVVLGGATRTESVKNALGEVTGDIVLIHDGARPFVDRQSILRCIESVKTYGSGICSVTVTDTAYYDGGKIDRDKLRLVQTPQGFFTADIKRAYALAGGKVFTDDSAVFAEFIKKPHFIDGSAQNFKITYRDDLTRGLPPPIAVNGVRTGFGADVHAFGKGDFVTLAGVKIPCDGALIAHSDGDVVIHAVMDAILSAAGLDDIGHYFPDSDESFKGADSGELLKKVIAVTRATGLTPSGLSVCVQAEKPRLAKHIAEMKENLHRLTGVAPESIGISAGTCEGLGFVGEGLGIAASCTAVLTLL